MRLGFIKVHIAEFCLTPLEIFRFFESCGVDAGEDLEYLAG